MLNDDLKPFETAAAGVEMREGVQLDGLSDVGDAVYHHGVDGAGCEWIHVLDGGKCVPLLTIWGELVLTAGETS
jgi:hypothetical protein